MKSTLVPGVVEDRTLAVDTARTIGFMGEDLRVYATPSMVLDVEQLCRDMLMNYAEGAEDSVGAKMEISHLGPTLLGQNVVVRATVSEVQLPKVVFSVEVSDEVDVVGRATHVRFVVDTVRQKERLVAKKKRWKEHKAATQ
jgi:fluoroacetyl-CoA thioesterase